MNPEQIKDYRVVEPSLPEEDKRTLIAYYEKQFNEGTLEPEKRDSESLTGVIEGSKATPTTAASSKKEEAVAKNMANLMEDLDKAKENPTSHEISDEDVDSAFADIMRT